MLLDDLASYIDTNSTKFALNTSLFKAKMLDSGSIPNTVTVLYETAGLAPTWTFSTGAGSRTWETAGLQVLSRSTSYQTARNNAETVYTLLDGKAHLSLSTAAREYLTIDAVSQPFSIGWDDNQRAIISCNYLVRKVTG